MHGLPLKHSKCLQVLWVAADGGEGVWVHATTSGMSPGLRAYHSADAFNGERLCLQSLTPFSSMTPSSSTDYSVGREAGLGVCGYRNARLQAIVSTLAQRCILLGACFACLSHYYEPPCADSRQP